MRKKKAVFNKYTFIVLLGFGLEILSSFFTEVVVRNGLVLGGLFLIFVGMILMRKANPYSGRRESALCRELGFDFEGLFNSYLTVNARKSGIRYSSWKEDVLSKYPPKSVSEDLRYYLKDCRRRALEKVDTVKTILIPAELGIIASVYELDIEPLTGEMKLVVVLIMSACLCLLCSVEIDSGNKVAKFVEDLCEVLEIPLGDSGV